MRYKMQFTVCNDDVKQDRKLPTISFFDTDGNPIDLGAGVGGGGGDVSALLPRDGSRPMTDALELMDGSKLFWDPNYGSLALRGPIDAVHHETDLYIQDTSSPDTLSNVGLVASDYHSGVNLYTENGGGLALQTYLNYGPSLSFTTPAGHISPIINSRLDAGGYDNLFGIDSEGKIQWGDGTAAPDVSLERTNQGSVQLAGNGEWDYTDFVVGKYNNLGDHANLEMYADAEEAYLAITYPAGSDLANEILSAHIYGEQARYSVHLDGSMRWGGGIAQPDTHIFRMSPGALKVVASPAQSETDLVVESPTTGDHVYLGAYDGGSYIQMTGDDQDLYLGDILKIHGGVQIDDALDFNGASSTAGATFGWDDDWAGMVLKGRAGSGDSELYVVHPDNSAAYANLYFIGGSAVLLLTDANGHSGFLTAGSPAGDHLGLTMNGDLAFFGGKSVVLRSPDNSFHRLKVANDGSLSTESVS